jgi:hypothetical protein
MKILKENEPIHAMFELSYAHYIVLPRAAMQSMPLEWQERFVKCVDQLREALPDRYRLPEGLGYFVQLQDMYNRQFVSVSADPLNDYERGRRMIKMNKYKK